MRALYHLLFLLVPCTFFGQDVYYSPFTETFPNIYRSEFEKINRRIFFEPYDITIVTETQYGKDIEILNIQETRYIDDRFILLCKNKSKRKITIALPEEYEQLLYIDYYYRSPTTNEKIQVRFHVEEMQIDQEDLIKIGNG